MQEEDEVRCHFGNLERLVISKTTHRANEPQWRASKNQLTFLLNVLLPEIEAQE
jgi:hypothetical protein